MSRYRRRALLAALALTAALALSLPANSFIPRADRVVAAIAAANRASGRTQALRLSLTMRIGDEDPIATGELVTHPTGLARLELRGANDLLERHVLQGSEHLASRYGRPLRRPRAFLPPLFLLQADSAVTLDAALATFGVEVGPIGLAPCGSSDCYVLGDPARVPPAQHPTAGTETAEPEPLGSPIEPDSGGWRPIPFPANDGSKGGRGAPIARGRDAVQHGDPASTIWVDIDTYEVRRIDSENGVVVFLGPLATFDQIRVPLWLVIEEPGEDAVRYDILRLTPVNAPAGAFGRNWLLDDPDEESSPEVSQP